MSTSPRVVAILGGLSVALGAGCDKVDWPDPRYVDSLRVLGVRAEPPTLTQGASTQLTLLCVDGSEGPRRDPVCNAEVAWFAQCDNPEKNDPETCLNRYATWANSLDSSVAQTPTEAYPHGFGFGPTFNFSPPEDILANESTAQGNPSRYGTSYVYFAACAGHLVPVHHVKDRLPVECRDPDTNELLDHRRFVAGITTVYSYDRFTSRNPMILAPRFDGKKTSETCSKTTPCASGFECSTEGACLPVVQHCTESEPEDCQSHCLTFALDLDSFSLFDLDGGRLPTPQKSLWVNYFTNAGNLPDRDDDSDEASFGVRAPDTENDLARTPCIDWRPPRSATEHAHVWAIVRDNRGGLAVWDQRIVVR